MVSRTELRMDSDVSVDGENLTFVVDAEEGIGYSMVYTIGDFVVPRAWVLDKAAELGIDESYLPPEVTPKRAFNRTRDRLVDDYNDEAEIGGRTVGFEVKKSTSDRFHVIGSLYVSASELERRTGEAHEDGEWRHHELGVVRYNKDNEGIETVAKIDEDNPLWDAWERFRDDAHTLYQTMNESHIGRDFQRMLYHYTHNWTDSIKLRDGGAMYFVPSYHKDSMDQMKEMIDSINRKWKTRGKNAHVYRIPVVDDAEQREMVQERAKIHVQERIDSILSDAFDEFDEIWAEEMEEEAEEMTEELVAEVKDHVSDTGDFIEQYNRLLETEMSVKSVVESYLSDHDVEGMKEELAEAAIEAA